MPDAFGSAFGTGQFVADVASITPTIPPSAFKDPVRASTTAPINLATAGLFSPDGISSPLLDGDSVLVQFQATASQNGIYLAHATAWTRRSDFDAGSDNISGSITSVQEGTLYGNKLFVCTTDNPITVGTTALNFTSIGSVAGSVTSVGLSAPAEFTISGSPVLSAGTLGLAWASSAQNAVFAGPSGSAGTPAFRALVSSDIPALNFSKITAGIVPIAQGGTALSATPTNGQLLIGNGTGYTLASLTAGTGISITPGAGSISIASTVAGTVTSVDLTAPGIFSVSGNPVTTSGTLALALATQSANLVWAGPNTGAATSPTFRFLVIADLPTSIPFANLAADVASTAYVNDIYDIGGGSYGTVAANAYVLNYKAVRAMTLPANFANSGVEAITAATASTVFTVLKNGVSIGTMTFAAAGTVPTFSVAGTTSLAVGDTLRIKGPGTPDTTLADLAITLKATLT